MHIIPLMKFAKSIFKSICAGLSRSEAGRKTAGVRNRDGIALVVVLGFLAVLTIMAMGLVVSMRTERLASKSYLDMVNARLYCNVGLADSMVWVEEFLATANEENFVVAPCFRGANSKNWSQYFWMLPSRDPVVRNPEDYDTFQNSFFDGIGTNFLPYVPIRYRYELPSGTNDVSKMGVQWIHTTDPSGKVNGRYMYMIFECSAFVDVNYLRREIVPGFRTGGDWDMITDPDQFFPDRENDSRYETERDVADGNEWVEQTMAASADWFHFSYSPPMQRIKALREDGLNRVEFIEDLNIDGSNTSKAVVLPVSAAGIMAKRNDIEEAFRALADSATWRNAEGRVDKEDLFELLVDYCDSDFTPENNNFNRASIEPVPMVNEIVVSSNTVSVEVWCPYVGESTARYSGSFDIDVEIDGISGTLSANMPAWSSDVEPPLPKSFEVALPSAPSNSTMTVKVSLRGSGGRLDEVTLDGVPIGKSLQCNDPRFNHVASQWKQYDAPTLDALNKNMLATCVPAIDNTAPYLVDGDYMMYCANDDLDCAGDLGYLPVAPWRTLKLYEDSRNNVVDMDPVLDYLSMQDEVAYGKCNPNAGSHLARTIQSIFDAHNQVAGGYLGMFMSETNNIKDEFLYENLISTGHGFGRNLMVGFRSNGMPSINLSDFGDRLFRWDKGGIFRNKSKLSWFKDQSATDPQYSELRLEHLMRRASALASIRQNLFLVCIWAQKLGTPQGGETEWNSYPILSEAQAVALAWRDPYPVANDNQYHPKFVRYMRWME